LLFIISYVVMNQSRSTKTNTKRLEMYHPPIAHN